MTCLKLLQSILQTQNTSTILPSSVHAALCVATEQRQAFLYFYISAMIWISILKGLNF